jgi:hypothetical protein
MAVDDLDKRGPKRVNGLKLPAAVASEDRVGASAGRRFGVIFYSHTADKAADPAARAPV